MKAPDVSRLLATLALALACGAAAAASPPPTTPIPDGARLGLVLANQFSDITLLYTGAQGKSTPANSPWSYADLVFTALTPCRLYDSRATYGGTGIWNADTTHTVTIGPTSSYASQGGSATNCGITGTRKIAAIMAAVSTTAQADAGYLTLFSAGAANPFPNGVSQAYQSGSVQTTFVIIPTDAATSALASGYTSARTHVIIDVVGYFSALPSTLSGENVNLINSTASGGNIFKGGVAFIHNLGTSSTFVGQRAGNFPSVDSAGNTAVGYETMIGASTAAVDTTAVGDWTLYHAAGVGAISIGAKSGWMGTDGSHVINISFLGLEGESNTIRVGFPNWQKRVFIAGIHGVTTDVADGIPVVASTDSNGFAPQLGTMSSSRRNKVDIADMQDASGTLMRLRPVTFRYKSDKNPAGPRPQYGLVSEDVAAVDPGLVVRSSDGETETVLYQFLPPMLLGEFQRQQQTIEEHAAKIGSLEARAAKMNVLEEELVAIKARLGLE